MNRSQFKKLNDRKFLLLAFLYVLFFFFFLKNLVFIFESNKLSEDIKVSKPRSGLSLDKRNVLMNYLITWIN